MKITLDSSTKLFPQKILQDKESTNQNETTKFRDPKIAIAKRKPPKKRPIAKRNFEHNFLS